MHLMMARIHLLSALREPGVGYFMIRQQALHGDC
jgi:hypothetical protein